MRKVLDQRFSDFILIDRPDLYGMVVDIGYHIECFDVLATSVENVFRKQSSIAEVENMDYNQKTAVRILKRVVSLITDLNTEFHRTYKTYLFPNDYDTNKYNDCISLVNDFVEMNERLLN